MTASGAAPGVGHRTGRPEPPNTLDRSSTLTPNEPTAIIGTAPSFHHQLCCESTTVIIAAVDAALTTARHSTQHTSSPTTTFARLAMLRTVATRNASAQIRRARLPLPAGEAPSPT